MAGWRRAHTRSNISSLRKQSRLEVTLHFTAITYPLMLAHHLGEIVRPIRMS